MNGRLPCALLLGAILVSGGCVSASEPPTTSAAPQAASAKDDPAIVALSPEEKVKLARSLTEQAIKLRTDPEGALRLLQKACEVAEMATGATNFKDLIVEFKPDEVDLSRLIASKTSLQERKTPLSARVTLVETYRIEECPFTVMVDSGKGGILPIPMKGESLQLQAIELAGKKVCTTKDFDDFKKCHVSPDERFVLLENWLRKKPFEILDLPAGSVRPVEAPLDFEGHAYVYPYGFLRWAQDSKTFLAEVNGSYVKMSDSKRAFLAYREIWSFDTTTGKATRVKRDEQPWRKNLKWDAP